MQHKPKSKLLVFAVAAGTLALILFLVVFISTGRANTPHPKANLRLPVPSIPILPTPSTAAKRFLPTPEPVKNTTPSAEVENEIETSPVSLPRPTPKSTPLPGQP